MSGRRGRGPVSRRSIRSRLGRRPTRPACREHGVARGQLDRSDDTLHAQQPARDLPAGGGARKGPGCPGIPRGRWHGEGHVVQYATISTTTSTTVGEVDGRRTSRSGRTGPRFSRFAASRRGSSGTWTRWLKTHAFFVTAVCGAIYLAGGDCRRLSLDDAALELLVAGVREGFGAVRATGLPVTPFSLNVLFTWLPKFFAIRYWRRFFSTNTAEYVFGAHARAAAGEMLEVARDCRALLQTAGVDAVSWQRLMKSIESYATSSPGGIHGLPPG